MYSVILTELGISVFNDGKLDKAFAFSNPVKEYLLVKNKESKLFKSVSTELRLNLVVSWTWIIFIVFRVETIGPTDFYVVTSFVFSLLYHTWFWNWQVRSFEIVVLSRSFS